jgi:hypothetical protein
MRRIATLLCAIAPVIGLIGGVFWPVLMRNALPAPRVLVLTVPSGFGRALTTRPRYRSSHVWVSIGPERGPFEIALGLRIDDAGLRDEREESER